MVKGVRLLYRTIVVITMVGVTAVTIFFSKSMVTNLKFRSNEISDTYQNNSKRYFLLQDQGYKVYMKNVALKRNFTDDDLVKRFDVRTNGSDVIVFLRVQKTGTSTLSRHLSNDVDLRPACNCSTDIKNCSCRHRWISTVLLKVSNYDGICGMHSGYAALLPCVDKTMDHRNKQHIKRRHLYITMVRDPLKRYLSEWMHVRVHGQWGTSPRDCRYPTASNIWRNVTLEQFMKCPSNPAVNLQTHMLGLKNPLHRLQPQDYKDRELLKSAMNNLKHFTYFGITEYQELSQILFEQTFNIHFLRRFETEPQLAVNSTQDVTDEQRREIIRMNWLDMQYYEYAEELFRLRVLRLIEITTDVTLKEKLLVLSRRLLRNISDDIEP